MVAGPASECRGVEDGVEYLKTAGDSRAEAVQDLIWALLNSRDFVLAH